MVATALPFYGFWAWTYMDLYIQAKAYTKQYPDDSFVTFDGQNLFTKLPTQYAIHIIDKKLRNDEELHQRTQLPVNTLTELLVCCLLHYYFQMDNKYYKQTDGLHMGSLLSPLMTNLYMEYYEDLTIGRRYKNTI